ncbi:hypothetical protein ROHU_003095 [Labeo rohita]|uniref:Integrase core domain-containing protein n=1 Tax=Labeo rohita TaxID=84645 RepID=A0A498NWA4_LABRO|nr:hypothetical protein ROHU_003095 [Labeo rohita]
MDPSGVQLRHRRRFIRRGYFTAGPNQVWHIDGYDKLKPFGVAISGCIDGFSRKVMWLRSGSSYNDPGIIAYYYMKCASEFGVPARLRTDCGTENGTMVAIHCALRAQHTDDFAGVLSHMYGTSTANQHIESWWSFFRKQRTQFWIDLFSDLRERHLFNGSHEHKCLLRYVFLGILQKDLDEYRELWNNHTIRPVRQSSCHSGKPEAMYHLPHSSCGRNVSFVMENARKPLGEDQASCQAVPRVTDACAVPGKSASAVVQFMKYRELKETERKTFSKSKKKSNKPVKISVGIMNKTKNGLRPMRGKNLPLHVDPQWSSEQLLAAALKKQKDFNQDMEDGEYVLLYPDGSQIKNIPGTDTPFTIGEYKEAIGKAYQRITLYICTLEDLLSKSKY